MAGESEGGCFIARQFLENMTGGKRCNISRVKLGDDGWMPETGILGRSSKA